MATQVTVLGAWGANISISDNAFGATLYSSIIASQITSAVRAGLLRPFDYTGSISPAASGPSNSLSPYYLIDTISGSVVDEPVGTSAMVIAASGGATVHANSADNQSIVAGLGPINFSAKGGSGAIAVTASSSRVDIANSSAGAWRVYADAINETISAAAGLLSATLAVDQTYGVSGDTVLLGNGQSTIQAGSADTILGGSGTASIGANRSVVVAGDGNMTVAGNGTDTIMAFAQGHVRIDTTGGEFVALGQATVTLNDAALVQTVFVPKVDTVFAGASSLTIRDSGNGVLLIGGSGPINVSTQPIGSAGQPLSTIGASTIFGVGSAVTVHGGAPVFVSTNNAGGKPSYFAAANASSFYTGDADLYIGGSGGNNSLIAGAGQTTIFGGGSGDVLGAAYAGNDIIVGSSGTETITGIGSTGNDTFFGGNGTNLIQGGSGNDTIVAGGGANTISSGIGHNLIFLGAGTASVHAGGTDTVVGGGGPATVRVDGNTLAFAVGGPMIFSNGAGSSTLVGGAQSVTMYGGSGGGLFAGGIAGNNLLVAGAGPTTLFGGGSGDVLISNGGVTDILQAGYGSETLNASGAAAGNILSGGSGDDVMLGGAGNDTLIVGNGNETLSGGGGSNLYVIYAAGDARSIDVRDFQPGADFFTLQSYSKGSLGIALQSASTVNGTESITLPDSTRITFEGVTGLNAKSFV